MFDKFKLNIREGIDRMKLKSERNYELRELKKEEKFEKEVQQLDYQIELEERRAELRALKSVNVSSTPQKGTGVKGAFSMFQDFASDFAQRQEADSKRSKKNNNIQSGSLLEPTIKINMPGGKRI